MNYRMLYCPTCDDRTLHVIVKQFTGEDWVDTMECVDCLRSPAMESAKLLAADMDTLTAQEKIDAIDAALELGDQWRGKATPADLERYVRYATGKEVKFHRDDIRLRAFLSQVAENQGEGSTMYDASPYEFEFLTENGVAWRVHNAEDADDDWADVVKELCRVAEHELDDVERLAFDLACVEGLGPDAIADANGWRWVAEERHVRIAAALLDLESLLGDEATKELRERLRVPKS